MKVNVSVATAPSAKYGVLRGTVSQVSQTPLSTAAVKALVANPDLAAVLTQGGPPVLAEVRLTRDASNRSGFAWSTPKGPPFPLQIGSQVTAQVIQTQQRPIDVVFGTS
jgi:HlyD family secretion protein